MGGPHSPKLAAAPLPFSDLCSIQDSGLEGLLVKTPSMRLLLHETISLMGPLSWPSHDFIFPLIEYRQVAHGFGKTFSRRRTDLLVILALFTSNRLNKSL